MAAPPSLTRKLILLVLAGVGAALAVSTGITVWRQVSDYGAVRRQALVATAQIFAAAIGPAARAQDAQEAVLALRAIARVLDMKYAEIRTMQGHLLASLGRGTRLVRDLTLEGDEQASA